MYFILRQIFLFCPTKSCVVSTEFCQLSLGMEFIKLSFNVFCDLKREDLVCMFVVMAIFTVKFLFPCCRNCEHENIFSYLTNCVQVYGTISINWLRDSQPSLQEQHNLAWGSYSRAKVKLNVNRVDNMIIQSISLLDQLDKDINTFSMYPVIVYSLIYIYCIYYYFTHFSLNLSGEMKSET